MNLWIGTNRYIKITDTPEARNELCCCTIAFRMRLEMAAIWRIASQRNKMPNTHLPIGFRKVIDFALGSTNASDMGGRRNSGFPEQTSDCCVGTLASASTRPIGDRNELWVKLLEAPDRVPEFLFR